MTGRSLSPAPPDRAMRSVVIEDNEDVRTTIAALLQRRSTQALSSETHQLSRAITQEGRTRRRLHKSELRGGWPVMVDGVNDLLDGLNHHMEEIARVVTCSRSR